MCAKGYRRATALPTERRSTLLDGADPLLRVEPEVAVGDHVGCFLQAIHLHDYATRLHDSTPIYPPPDMDVDPSTLHSSPPTEPRGSMRIAIQDSEAVIGIPGLVALVVAGRYERTGSLNPFRSEPRHKRLKK
jgi:hypothetical protein